MKDPLILYVLICLVLMTPGITFAQQENHEKYQYCLLCHGSAGQGNSVIQAPAIAGIDEFYLRQQLSNYRTKIRGGDYKVDPSAAEMAAVARDVADDEIPDITKYLSSLQFQEASHDSFEGNINAGQISYSQVCSACHGVAAEGNELLNSPALAYLNDWYLVSSFNKYIDGPRGNSTQNVSAQQMRAISEGLPEDFSIEDVAVYIRSLSVNDVND